MLGFPEISSKLLAAITAGGLVLLLGLAAVRSESDLRLLNQKDYVRHEVENIEGRMVAEINAENKHLQDIVLEYGLNQVSLDERVKTLSSGPYQPWWSDGKQIVFTSSSSLSFKLSSDQLIDQVINNSSPFIGPLTTDNGQEICILQAHVKINKRNSMWFGVMISLDDYWEITGLNDLIRSGYEVRVENELGNPVYWTSPEHLEDPISRSIKLIGSSWNLSAAPRGGWTDARITWSTVVVALILSFGYALWYMFLSLRPDTLREELLHLRERLIKKDSELSEILRSRFQLEAQLKNSLTVDVRTGLPNRESFLEHLQTVLRKRRLIAEGETIVITIRFTKLEEMTHSMGSGIADQVMMVSIDRLRKIIDFECYLARTGEKELAVCVDSREINDLETFADEIQHLLEEQYMVGRRSVYSPTSIGIATSKNGYEHGADLLASASLAAGTAVENGERWSIFQPETKEEKIGILQLEADLQLAIDNDDLLLNFQPIVSITDGSIVGLESLLRWKHPKESWISPDRFIPLAESMGQMSRISELVMRKAIAHSKQWLNIREIPIYITINLTPRDLNNEKCKYLFELLDKNNVPPQCIRVEVTETAVVRDVRMATRIIRELNDRGVLVLMDDFGTGYSSLSYLRDLPFHAVKIDRSFIQKITTEARDLGLVKSIVSLVHYLGMECVAEGIETQEQLDLVAMVNFNYGQGYFFSRPVPAEEVESLITRQSSKLINKSNVA